MWWFNPRFRDDESPYRLSALGLLVVAVAHAAVLRALTVRDISPIALPSPPVMVRVIPPEPPKPKPAEMTPPTPKPVAPQPPPKPRTQTRPIAQRPLPKPAPVQPPEPARLAAPVDASAPSAAEVAAKAPGPQSPDAGSPSPARPSAAISAPRFDADYLHNPAPAYPAMAKRMGEEGKVVLRVYVEPDGKPGQVQVKTGSGSARLDEAAQEAVRRWKFVPARRGGDHVGAWVLVPIVFNLRG